MAAVATRVWTAEEVRGLRQSLGWSQVKLAESLGCYWQTVAAWEAGRQLPRGVYVRQLNALAAVQE